MRSVSSFRIHIKLRTSPAPPPSSKGKERATSCTQHGDTGVSVGEAIASCYDIPYDAPSKIREKKQRAIRCMPDDWESTGETELLAGEAPAATLPKWDSEGRKRATFCIPCNLEVTFDTVWVEDETAAEWCKSMCHKPCAVPTNVKVHLCTVPITVPGPGDAGPSTWHSKPVHMRTIPCRRQIKELEPSIVVEKDGRVKLFFLRVKRKFSKGKASNGKASKSKASKDECPRPAKRALSLPVTPNNGAVADQPDVVKPVFKARKLGRRKASSAEVREPATLPPRHRSIFRRPSWMPSRDDVTKADRKVSQASRGSAGGVL